MLLSLVFTWQYPNGALGDYGIVLPFASSNWQITLLSTLSRLMSCVFGLHLATNCRWEFVAAAASAAIDWRVLTADADDATAVFSPPIPVLVDKLHEWRHPNSRNLCYCVCVWVQVDFVTLPSNRKFLIPAAAIFVKVIQQFVKN